MLILDGYNLLFRWTELSGSLEQKRRRLLDGLHEGHPLKEFLVVFDGRWVPPEGGTGYLGRIRIEYTMRGITADQYILDFLEQQPHRARFTVVTGDRALARMVGQLGARVEGPERWVRDLSRAPPEMQPIRVPRSSREYLAIFEERWRKRGEDPSDLE